LAKFCKELCFRYKKQPYGLRFKDNKTCRVCSAYYPIGTDAGSVNICFCCKNKLATKPKRNRSKWKIKVGRY